MKTLYREVDVRYTHEASALDMKVANVLTPIFKEYADKGYSPREIGHIMMHAVIDVELMTVLGMNDFVADGVKVIANKGKKDV